MRDDGNWWNSLVPWRCAMIVAALVPAASACEHFEGCPYDEWEEEESCEVCWWGGLSRIQPDACTEKYDGTDFKLVDSCCNDPMAQCGSLWCDDTASSNGCASSGAPAKSVGAIAAAGLIAVAAALSRRRRTSSDAQKQVDKAAD